MVNEETHAPIDWQAIVSQRERELKAALIAQRSAEAERDQAQATIARVREAIKDERAAARRIVDQGRDQGGAWVNLMHSCALFLAALDPPTLDEPGEPT